MDYTNFWPVAVLFGVVALVFAQSGKSKAKPSSTMYLGDVAFGPGLPAVKVFTDTGRGDIGPDCMNVVTGFITFPEPLPETGWHAGMMTRADPASIPTKTYNGIGTIWGTVMFGGAAGMKDIHNQAAVEVWQIGHEPPNFQWVKPETISPGLVHGVRIPFTSTSIFRGDERTYQYMDGLYVSPIVTHDKAIRSENAALAFFCIGEVPVLIENLSSEWRAL